MNQTERNTRIIYEDKYLLVAEKPAGIASQSEANGDPGILEILSLDFGSLHIINRLDKTVRGLVLFARDTTTAAKLSSAPIKKTYEASIVGVPSPSSGELRNFIIKDSKKKMAVITENHLEKGAKEALLRYRILDIFSIPAASFMRNIREIECSRVEVELVTGRFHQIRAQFANIGCPILGDRKYGSAKNNTISKSYIPDFPALASVGLEFEHPSSGSAMSFRIV